ncbi:MerR-type HTH domain [Moorella glycerini]|uniref:HTH-type transcriptional regulator GlnR n=1 Tax=Neomoorella stamsii TaxID=1266720 RepID=A0A9X7J246_9FIRM|nr:MULTISPECIES: MerR family transcriptional regulator [Moorella]PRR70380.1 HTH-type transcriptional regulator GlnR [Moorella stamsii]CEP66385.1 MerR-type HTH domain [Moorella glycerini]
MPEQMLYTISVVADLLGIQPGTLRVWERHKLIQPARKNGRRLYSNNDLKRLRFIQKLIDKGFNLNSIKHYLAFYPCWLYEDCPACSRKTERIGCAKPCWKEEGTYCQISFDDPSLCNTCPHRSQEIK